MKFGKNGNFENLLKTFFFLKFWLICMEPTPAWWLLQNIFSKAGKKTISWVNTDTFYCEKIDAITTFEYHCRQHLEKHFLCNNENMCFNTEQSFIIVSSSAWCGSPPMEICLFSLLYIQLGCLIWQIIIVKDKNNWISAF